MPPAEFFRRIADRTTPTMVVLAIVIAGITAAFLIPGKGPVTVPTVPTASTAANG